MRRLLLLGLAAPSLVATASPAGAEEAAALESAATPKKTEELFLQWASELGTTGGVSKNTTEDMLAGAAAEPGLTSGLLLAGGALFFIFGILLPVLKVVFAGGVGLFFVREAQTQFQGEGRQASKVVERAVRRLSGEPADLLDERKLRVRRLNDEFVSLQASLLEQTEGKPAAAALRDKARRTRFVSAWKSTLDGLEVTPEERRKFDEAVTNFAKDEFERREQVQEARSNWLKSALNKGSSFGSLYYRFQLGANLNKQLSLQDKLVTELKDVLPKKALARLKEAVGTSGDIRWVADANEHNAGAAPAAGPASPVYVLSFNGDPSAAGVALLAQEITAVLGATSKPREVVLRVKSPGGTVTGYGLAAAQLMRLRQHGVKLVVSVDELAASGGYLMACCADKIICSPFAAIGSIGVISGVPNVADRLDREGLKVIQTTAGKWKRTVDPFQPPTQEALDKAKDDIMMVYRQFANFVKTNRPHVNIEEVATGEVWFGSDALARGLVDELQTSTEYLQQHITDGCEVLALSYSEKPAGLAGRLGADGAAEVLGDVDIRDAVAALRAAGKLRDLAASAGTPGAWPAAVPQPRFQAENPLADLYPR